MTRAVVFANSNVGARCLEVLLACGIEVPLVVTHAADASEAAFANVAALAGDLGLRASIPDDPHVPEFVDKIRRARPDFIFSFYYRQMLKREVLDIAARGALNMHGSLLPSYRGRVPVNWAVIRGEHESGATLHYMTEKPDAGDIVDQQAVPILPNDTAFEVFNKITVAAEIVLWRTLPALKEGRAPRITQDASRASYFGRRRPEDGQIDWCAPAHAIHDLVRGVAPPYPGAFTVIGGHKVRILRTRLESGRVATHAAASMHVDGTGCFIDSSDRRVLRIVEADIDGVPVKPIELLQRLGSKAPLRLTKSDVKETT